MEVALEMGYSFEQDENGYWFPILKDALVVCKFLLEGVAVTLGYYTSDEYLNALRYRKEEVKERIAQL